MVKIRNNFDGGTNGTGMTVPNTGGASGTAFTAVEVAATFSNEQSETPPLSMKPPTTAITGYGRWTVPDRNISTRLYLYTTTAHSADYNFLQFRDATSAVILTIRINGANALRAFVTASAANAWTASGTLPLNQQVRVECLYEQGVANNDGRVRVAYFLGDLTTPIQDSGWITGQNFRGDVSATSSVYVGKIQTTAYPGSLYLDTVAVDTGVDYTGNFIGPDVPAAISPTYRWSGTAYVPLDTYRWNGTAYVALDRATP